MPPETGYSVRDICARYRVGQSKVLTWIRNNELAAVNVAGCLAGKPQWRITPDAVQAFEQQRRYGPAPKAPRRKRQPIGMVDFFPE
jgi:hypothetical protein